MVFKKSLIIITIIKLNVNLKFLFWAFNPYLCYTVPTCSSAHPFLSFFLFKATFFTSPLIDITQRAKSTKNPEFQKLSFEQPKLLLFFFFFFTEMTCAYTDLII